MKKRTNYAEVEIGRRIPAESVKRLSLYLRNLKKLREDNVVTVSSGQLTRLFDVSPGQFRKDLSLFGGFGRPGVGYAVNHLIFELERILGINQPWDIALIGVGSLGRALLKFAGFSKFNIKITQAFDVDEKIIGKLCQGIRVRHVKYLETVILKEKIKVAIMAIPPESAQKIAGVLSKAGIKGILNFTPVALRLPKRIYVSNVDMACELETLIFFVKERNLTGG